MTQPSPRRIAPVALKAALKDSAELAILDARELGEFGASHLFWAVPCPLSTKEATARALVPRRATAVVCTDGGEGYAETLAAYLTGIGYTDVAVLEGGTPGWKAAGFEVFSGVHVPSKAFGEWVEHHFETPSIDPPELAAMLGEGSDMVVLDSRPMDEFHKMAIPTGINVPGAELAYRARDLAPDPATTIVVNCAGRTRSILGAESLRQAGLPNPIVALRNGTMGWELAGFESVHGRTERYAEGTPEHLDQALAGARAFAERHGVKTCTREQAFAMAGDSAKTTYLLDVRDPAEYAQGHLRDSRCAPGGQLVQATDQWVAVRNARIVLVCDTGVRSRMTGGWLRLLGGWEVFVCENALDGRLEEGQGRPSIPEAEALKPATVTAPELASLMAEGGVQVIQLSRSIAFREGHIPGAIWGIRTRLAKLVPQLSAERRVVIAAEQDWAARLATAELQPLVKVPVRVLAGGVAGWRAAGLPLLADRYTPEDEDCADWYLRAYDRNSGQEAAMREYLAWEIDLVEAIERDGDARFGAWA
ncbi:rhodanese-like domain-containing protein [Plastoroseomonas arctica]|uniref:Thiosulfate sulfurtransferase n=1 Tax=Plastoroseomonas arctica TaxID=1509237 RepID=A0AAF1K0C8_9PROT|nr:rhodanese-like domain-containing protein [Plastoroseomonas arctica]MBR0657481.1 thiosulfate sulfurtransferase [Plastoroseomonas arctica]